MKKAPVSGALFSRLFVAGHGFEHVADRLHHAACLLFEFSALARRDRIEQKHCGTAGECAGQHALDKTHFHFLQPLCFENYGHRNSMYLHEGNKQKNFDKGFQKASKRVIMKKIENPEGI